MNKYARTLRDTYGVPYQYALRLIQEHGLEYAVVQCEQRKAEQDAELEALDRRTKSRGDMP